MISQTIARRYAQALLALGREDDNFAKYGEELDAFIEALSTSGLFEALSNPIYPADARRQVLNAVLEKMSFTTITTNFLKLLQDKGRMNHIMAIRADYQKLVDEVNNIRRATITTAAPISQAIADQVKDTLEKMTGKTIILDKEEDAEIIGGVVARVGDLILDGSVKTQLQNLKESLIKG